MTALQAAMANRLAVQTFTYWAAARAARGRGWFPVSPREIATLGEIAVFGMTARLRKAATAARLARQ